MNLNIESPDYFTATDSSAIKVSIVYEDFACGLRAKSFAERLAGQLGTACQLSESFWRSDLLECPPVAAEAARTAVDSDYLIVALRGDHAPPISTAHWIEAQLDAAAMRNMALIVLPDSEQGKWPVVEATRRHFRNACAMKGVAFFSHAMSPSVPCDGGEAEPPPNLLRPWTPGWSVPESENDRRHEFAHQN